MEEMSYQYRDQLDRLKASGDLVFYCCFCEEVAEIVVPEEAPDLVRCDCSSEYMLLIDKDCVPFWPHYHKGEKV